MWLADLILILIGLIIALILFTVLIAMIGLAVFIVKYWIEELQDNKEGFVHKLVEKLT